VELKLSNIVKFPNTARMLMNLLEIVNNSIPAALIILITVAVALKIKPFAYRILFVQI